VLVGHLLYIGVRVLIGSTIFLAVMTAFGAVDSPLALLTLPAALLTGLAFATPVVAYSAVLENDYGFAVLLRFVVVPLFLFGGVFYPVTQLPLVLEQLAYLTPLWHGVALSRELALGTATVGSTLLHVAYLACGSWSASRSRSATTSAGWRSEMARDTVTPTLAVRTTPLPLAGGRAWRLVERNIMVYRRIWVLIVSGFFEPLFYLLSLGVGIGALVGTVAGPDGQPIDYTAFVAPALLAASAMNGAIYDSTTNVFFKLKFAKTYDAMLATPLGPGDIAVGEITWAQLRGTLYSVAFLVVMAALGLITSWWALLALPATMLIGLAFAAVGMACTSFMRGWQDFEYVQLAILPMFLFSTTFFPLSVYPRAIQVVVQFTPLYHGIELVRPLTTGAGVGIGLLGHALYFVGLAAIGFSVTARRLERLLLK
jgi:lipooligosaccharide transport system permease protein